MITAKTGCPKAWKQDTAKTVIVSALTRSKHLYIPKCLAAGQHWSNYGGKVEGWLHSGGAKLPSLTQTTRQHTVCLTSAIGWVKMLMPDAIDFLVWRFIVEDKLLPKFVHCDTFLWYMFQWQGLIPFRAPVVVVTFYSRCGFLEADIVKAGKRGTMNIPHCVVRNKEVFLQYNMMTI